MSAALTHFKMAVAFGGIDQIRRYEPMLMTRFAYLCFTVLIFALNGVALWAVYRAAQPVDAIIPAALILNLVSWPLALIVAYRVGQVTGQEYFRKVRAKLAAAHAARSGRVTK
jgi:hypothetical protein